MGCVLGLASQLACCCTSAACSLCCAACPSCRNSTSTRLMYVNMLLLGAILSGIVLTSGLQEWLKELPFCRNSSELVPDFITADCSSAVGYLVVYRVCFALTCFFTLMAAIMIGAKSSRDGRAGLQNGFWGIKFLIVMAIIIGAIFIPNGIFAKIWMWVGLIGGIAFILLQLVLLVEFAHSWADKWVGNYEKKESRGWYCALLTATAIQYTISISGIVLLYIYYGCTLNYFFITFNMILCIIVSILSMLPSVQERISRSGLLQSSVVTLYIIYLTCSALDNNPNKECHADLPSIGNANKIKFDRSSIIGVVIWVFCLLYSSWTSALKVSEQTVPDVEKDAKEIEEPKEKEEKQIESGDKKPKAKARTKVFDNEENGVAYSWSLFHCVFAIATLYIMMTLTNWYQPNSALETFNANPASMWIKIVSSWICTALYGWSLIAPILLKNRVF